MKMNNEQEELLLSWLSEIGAIILFWSPIERSIDQIVHALYKSQNKSSKKKPLTLNRKLEYIKSCIHADVVSENDLESLINLTKKIVQIRNVCAHGMLHEFDENSIKIGKVQGKSEEHLIEVFTIDRNRLDKSVNKMTILSQDWGKLAETIVKKSLCKK